MSHGLVTRVVDGMVSKLTNHNNIQALIDPPSDLKPGSEPTRAIQEATTTLLAPLFIARSAAPKNTSFLSFYNRLLLTKLTPLLKNHLVPRVQAMIVLGQSGSLELVPTYVAQIKEPSQTVWVKLWALEGIVNTIEEGNRLNDSQSQVAKVVADFLSGSDEIPWPVQLRALEALSALKQGFEATHPERAAMATAAMKILADGDSKFEVRAEAARALGLMQITTAVRKYNYPLVAHSVGLLAADLGAQVNLLTAERVSRSSSGKAAMAPDAAKASAAKSTKSAAPAKGKAAEKVAGKGATKGILAPETPAAPPPVHPNAIKARYLTSILIGPVYQAFEGVPGPRGNTGGLIRSSSTDGTAYAENVFELVKPVAKGSIELITAGSRQVNDKKKDLQARVDALRDFLEKNAPPDRHLVQGGEDFPLAQAGK